MMRIVGYQSLRGAILLQRLGPRFTKCLSSSAPSLPSWLGGPPAPPGEYLAKYTINMMERPADVIIGRHDEIQRTIQILARKTKNNPVLIGNAGVGKTAIVEGLAQRILSGQVPESIQSAKIHLLDWAAVIAGAGVKGQFEDRIQGILRDIAANKNIILFLDELHLMVNAGKGEGSMDLGNMLKPALARTGDLQLIGATTLDEYRTSIEKDSALARRFQPVYVAEPNAVDTLSILRGLKTTYETHHNNIHIQDDALVAAVQLTNRYISDRKQPDKALDALDEACTRRILVECSHLHLL
jgi:ATP-dependent Clp protease ATP-binding subunit ClpB